MRLPTFQFRTEREIQAEIQSRKTTHFTATFLAWTYGSITNNTYSEPRFDCVDKYLSVEPIVQWIMLPERHSGRVTRGSDIYTTRHSERFLLFNFWVWVLWFCRENCVLNLWASSISSSMLLFFITLTPFTLSLKHNQSRMYHTDIEKLNIASNITIFKSRVSMLPQM
jgi:hypothetical protein